MAIVYKCPSDCTEYLIPPHDKRCERCGKLLKAERVPDTPAPAAAQQETALPLLIQLGLVEGLVILICDISYSMHDAAFPKEGEQLTKLRLVTDAIEGAFAHMHTLGKKDTAFVAIIAYGRRAKMITDRQGRPFFMPVSQILNEFGEPEARRKAEAEGLRWDDLTLDVKEKLKKEVGIGEYLHDQFLNDRPGVDRSGTNITAALKLGREIADATLAGDLTRFGIQNRVSLIEQKPFWSEKTGTITMPNIRAVIYSDGLHNIDEKAQNHFATFPPRSVLMTAFIGYPEASDEAKKGADEMKELANICPRHNTEGYFLVNSSLRRDYLRRLFHMATGISGLCPSCMLDEKEVGLEDHESNPTRHLHLTGDLHRDQSEDLTL